MADTSSVALKYNQQALVSTKQMLEGFVLSKDLLKAKLPNARTVIEIGVETTEKSGTSAAKVQRVAVIDLDNSPERNGKIGVKVSVYKHEEIEPWDVKLLTGKTKSSSKESEVGSQALIPVNAEKSLVVNNHELVSQQTLQSMKKMNAESRCPNALNVAGLLQRVFPNGIPLPGDTLSIDKYHFTVITKLPSERLEYISSYIGLNSWRGGSFSSTTVLDYDKDQKEHAFYDDAYDQFDHLVKAAQGKMLPPSMSQVGQIQSATFKGQISTEHQKSLEDNQ